MMKINQFIVMLLMALHFAPSNANKIRIEMFDNQKIIFQKQTDNYWEASPKNESVMGLFQFRNHRLYRTTNGEEIPDLSIEDVFGEAAAKINWQTAKILEKEGQEGVVLVKRKTNEVNLVFREKKKKRKEDEMVKIYWETYPK